MGNSEEVQELKERGNECVRKQQYAESIFHYTHAIKLDAQNYSLYSNRSLAFLKMQQFYYAMEDAKETIRLKPDWAKHPLLMALLTIAIAMIGYGIARGFRYYVKCQREALLEPPIDLLQG
ncbi:hypothetical protein C0J52_17430 [Blattella germanica]|nr:hypothetical protein C0J52_17430 [Blattella germanica]